MIRQNRVSDPSSKTEDYWLKEMSTWADEEEEDEVGEVEKRGIDVGGFRSVRELLIGHLDHQKFLKL